MALISVESTAVAPINGSANYEPAYDFGTPIVVPVAQAPAPVLAIVNPLQQLAAKGFMGLEDDYLTSPMISLKTDGQFEDVTGENYGKSFSCDLIGCRPKYAYSFQGSTDPKTELAYTYDQITTTKGGSLEDFKAGLVARGKEVSMKRYMEVDVVLSSGDPSVNGASRTLSIPPSSVSAFTAHMKMVHRMGTNSPTVCKVGDKVKHGSAPAYYPWSFSL